MLNFKINRRRFLYCVSICCIFFIVILSSLATVYFPRNTTRMMIPLLGIIILFFLNYTRLKRSISFESLWMLIAMVIVMSGYIYSGDSVFEYYFRYVLIFIGVMLLGNRIDWIEIFMKIMLIVGLIYILTTIWLSFDFNSYFRFFANNLYPNETRFLFWANQGFTSGITDHYSTNGMMLANAVIIIFAIGIVRGRNYKRYYILMILAIIALFLTGKRAHLLFTAVPLLIVTYVYNRYKKDHFVKYLCLIIVLSIVAVASYSFIPLVSNLIDRFVGIGNDDNMLGRYVYWQGAIESFKAQPLFGIGWLGFRNQVSPYVYFNAGTAHCHNIYIQLLCETGIIGSTFFYFWFVYCLYNGIKLLITCSKNRNSFETPYLVFSVYCVIFQLYFLLYGITGNPLYDEYVYPLYILTSYMSVRINKNHLR